MLQAQIDRIQEMVEANISGLSVAQFPPASIESRLPLLVPLEGAIPYNRRSQTEFDAVVVWDLYLYLAPLGSGLEYVNGVNLREYLDEFANLFLSRNLLQYAESGQQEALPYVRSTSFELTSGLSQPQRYPPRNGQASYWGCQYRLTVTSTNIIARK